MVVPEETRSTVMNWFRVPFNLIVAGVLLHPAMLAHVSGFYVCAGLAAVGMVAAYACVLSSDKDVGEHSAVSDVSEKEKDSVTHEA